MTIKELKKLLDRIQDPEIDVFFLTDQGKMQLVQDVDLKTANENGFCVIT